MADVLALGEAMVRLTPPDSLRLEQTVTLNVDVGGAELNVLVGLSRLGVGTAWLSKLPDNALGHLIAGRARAAGVDTSPVRWTAEGRAGLYFLELSAAPRPSQILYDRRNSEMTTLTPEEIDPATFAGARRFHVSGITPALSLSCLDATLAALTVARNAGCAVSFDPNYRARLWTVEEARAAYARILPGVDIPGTLDPDSHCAREGETFRLLANARWLPFFVAHGALDELVPVGSVLEQVAELDRLGYRYRFENAFSARLSVG